MKSPSLAIHLSRGLDGAHAVGIVHRDLAEKHLPVRRDEPVEDLDFGVCKRTNSRERSRGSTT